mmetsp:Transcript_74306/g.230501  ORF Transcript_74306/g.230501 Transcript_74306/m.230501 type:complete len:238 (+) Transcript_74306:854-1567(+)
MAVATTSRAARPTSPSSGDATAVATTSQAAPPASRRSGDATAVATTSRAARPASPRSGDATAVAATSRAAWSASPTSRGATVGATPQAASDDSSVAAAGSAQLPSIIGSILLSSASANGLAVNATASSAGSRSPTAAGPPPACCAAPRKPTPGAGCTSVRLVLEQAAPNARCCGPGERGTCVPSAATAATAAAAHPGLPASWVLPDCLCTFAGRGAWRSACPLADFSDGRGCARSRT